MMITYHKATVKDAPILVDNRLKFALELAGEQPEFIIEQTREQLSDYFARATAEGSCISFIARNNEDVAGIGSVHLREMPGNFRNPSGKWGYIMNMYTVPAYRRKGICRNILQLLLKEATEIGITAFELHATAEGEPVYRQEGFIKHVEPTYRKLITTMP